MGVCGSKDEDSESDKEHVPVSVSQLLFGKTPLSVEDVRLQAADEARLSRIGVRRLLIEHVMETLKTQFPDTHMTMTTTDVCHQLVMPLTAATQESLAAHFLAHHELKKHVGPATVFVSHAWKYSFWMMLETLLRYEAEEQPGALFWIDLVPNSQHKAIDYPHEWWATTFGNNIAAIGRVLLVMSPWNDPVPMTRCWCLFEIMHALQESVTLDIRLPKAEEEAFLSALTANGEGVLEMLVRVQASKAQAFNPKDKENIFKTIEERVGFGELNTRVKAQLRSWCLEQGERAVMYVEQDQGGTAAFARLCFQMANVMKDFGEHDKALMYYQKDLDVTLTVGQKEQHPDAASPYNGMALVFQAQGNYAKALEYYEKALELMLAVQHPRISSTYNNMAGVFQAQGEYDKALEYFNKDLEMTIAAHGEKHQSNGITYSNMALVFQAQGDYDKALEYYNKALEIKLETLGEQHPSTASTYNNMANLYNALGEFDKALEYYEKDLEISVATLGERHPDTAGTYNNIAIVIAIQGDAERAMQLFEKALEIKLESLGEQHPSVASTYVCMGNVLRHHDPDRALELFTRALDIRLTVLGERHPETAQAYMGIAIVLSARGEHEKAMDYYAKDLAIKLETLGERHPDIANTYANMANVFQEQGDNEKALQYFQMAMDIALASLGEQHPLTQQLRGSIECFQVEPTQN